MSLVDPVRKLAIFGLGLNRRHLHGLLVAEVTTTFSFREDEFLYGANIMDGVGRLVGIVS